MNKAAYLGLSILELSEILMYDIDSGIQFYYKLDY